jgi:1,4-alpha-glucan branching enzyme
VQRFVRDLNRVYASEPALHEIDFDWKGFDWVDFHDSDQSIISFLRKGTDPGEEVLVVVNFTPTPRDNYRLGVPAPGYYRELLNSDSSYYRGGNVGNGGGLWSEEVPSHGRRWSIAMRIPPLSVVFLKRG